MMNDEPALLMRKAMTEVLASKVDYTSSYLCRATCHGTPALNSYDLIFLFLFVYYYCAI